MKVFGIGLPKTGNHSLAEAMRMLGYNSRVYPTTESEIRENDFVCSDPIVVAYKQIDVQYPNSKFILMLRDEESWLKSITNHFQRKARVGVRPSRLASRLKLWGTTNPSSKIFLRVKRQYEEDVRRYFFDRPQDILYMSIINGDGWEKLCRFIGKSSPEVPFPKRNVTRNI